jgi:hypothetical protein
MGGRPCGETQGTAAEKQGTVVTRPCGETQGTTEEKQGTSDVKQEEKKPKRVRKVKKENT